MLLWAHMTDGEKPCCDLFLYVYMYKYFWIVEESAEVLSSLAQSEARKEMSIEVPVELSTQKEQVNEAGVFQGGLICITFCLSVKDGQWGHGGKKIATEKSEFATRPFATKISWWQIMV